MSVFDGIKFFCTSTLSDKQKGDLTQLLERNGAESVPLGEATHIIALSLDYEGQHDVKEGSVTVTDYWVERSLILKRPQLAQHFSPDPTMLFSGVVACATDLAPSDIEVLSAGITALGGQWRAGLTRDVTHLFAVGPGSEKYQTALHYQKGTGIKVLVPHWFDDSVRLGIRGLSTAAYEWPEPTILTFGKPSPETGEVGDSLLRPQNKPSRDKKALYKAVLMTTEQEVKLGQAEKRDIWGSRRIILSPDLDLSDDRRHAIEAGITRSGGIIVEYDPRRADAEYEFDVLIARHRWGPLYVQGVKGRKLVGSLTWLFHVESTGTIGTPTAQLLHYPIPKKPIDGFSAHEITVTNYTGDARDYLKKLIGLMGATFTPSMSGKNTVLIAAYISGNKASKARNWSIPVVNHTWLEDCFIQWRNLSVGLEKYIVFPPGLDFSDHLGERGIQHEVVYETLPDLITQMALAQAKLNPVGKDSTHRDGEYLSAVPMDVPSARRIKGKDTVGGPETEHGMNVIARSVENVEPGHAGRSSRQAGGGSSPLRHIASPLQRTYEGHSSSGKRQHRVDQEAVGGVSSSPKKSMYTTSPTNRSLVRSPSKARQDSPSKSRATTPRRMESVLMPPRGTGEALGRSPQPSAKKTSPVKAKLKGRGPESDFRERTPLLSSLTVDTSRDMEEGPSRRTSRRNAANKASQRLRDEVMPDVVNFEKEMRRGHVRAVNSPESEWRKEKTYAGKGKKRASIQRAAESGVSSDDERERKKRRLNSRGSKTYDRDDKGAGITGASSQETAKIPRKGGAKGAKIKDESSDGDFSKMSVGILTTQVILDENEEKALAKLGGRVGVKPDECTHLVVKTIARTEKLLCAMAVAPAVVTEKWVHDSIAAKKLLPANKYALSDPINEKKWKFKLADALKRAKVNKGQLFAGKVFYVTNKVPLDKKLLKNVVSAHGGQLRQQNPTIRMLSGGKRSEHHYVISCLEDAPMWRPIAEAGHPIYSQELILSAALTQEIRLNAEDVRLDTP